MTFRSKETPRNVSFVLKRSTNILFLLSFVLLMTCCFCSKDENVEPPIYCAGASIWSPDGSQIMFTYIPLLKIDDTTYLTIQDSNGLWLIEPEGSDLSMFLHFLPNSPVPTDWHPDGSQIVCYLGWGSPSLTVINLIDSSLIDVGYFAEGAYTARYSADGSKIMLAADDGDSNGIWIMDVDGSNERFLTSVVVWKRFDWSPDGEKLVFDDMDGGLSIMDTSGVNLHQIISGARIWHSSPSFSPDGEKIIFTMHEVGDRDFGIYVIDVDGSDLKKLDTGGFPTWSPDGSKIIYTRFRHDGSNEEGDGQLWIIDADGSNKTQLTFMRE